jgi:hypothetical protein
MPSQKSPSTHTHMPASAQAVVSHFPNKEKTTKVQTPDTEKQGIRETEKDQDEVCKMR